MNTNNNQKKLRHLMFPIWVLVLELILLLCDIFKISFYWLTAIHNLFTDATFCLNVSLFLFASYFIYKRNELEQVYTGLLICILDFVFINNLYSNQKLNSIVNNIKNFWINYKMGAILLFVIIATLCVLLIKFLLNGKGQKNLNKSSHISTPGSGSVGTPSMPQSATSKRQPPHLHPHGVNTKTDRHYKWVFISIFFFLCVMIFILLFAFAKGSLTSGTSPFQKLDILEWMGIISLLIICGSALIILITVMFATAYKYICDNLFHTGNKNLWNLFSNLTSEKVIKNVITLALTPIVYTFGAKYTFTEFNLLDWLSTGSMLPLLIALLISFVIAAIVVNIVTNLFDSVKFTKVKKIASDTIDQVIEICESLLKQLFSVIKACGPSFIEALCSLLFDDEEDN